MAAFLPDQDIGVVILWNSESSMPAALLPTTLDRALGLPARDWLAPEPVRPRRR
jgi:beta-lactamase class C